MYGTSPSFEPGDEAAGFRVADVHVVDLRPAEQPFMTAIITFADHPEGTEYTSYVMHKSQADRDMHEEMGFFDGWGTVIEQLARRVETCRS